MVDFVERYKNVNLINKNIKYTVATCSGKAQMAGNLLMMSVISWDSGSIRRPEAGFSRDDTLG